MEQTIKFKDKDIENYKEDLAKMKREIDNLNENIKANQIESDELKNKINSLENKLAEIISTPKVLERIKDKMLTKGFLSDQELNKICAEFNDLPYKK